MRIKEGFVKREVMGNTIVVPTGEAGESLRGVIKLNATGSFIWEAVAEGRTEEEIADLLVEKFEGVAKEKALSDVRGIIEKMKEAGVFSD